MNEHECSQLEFIGRVKEFMSDMKGFKATLFTISVAILVQVGAFIYLWGGLTTTVKTHDIIITEIGKTLKEIRFVGVAVAGEKGDKGEQGLRGMAGKDK